MVVSVKPHITHSHVDEAPLLELLDEHILRVHNRRALVARHGTHLGEVLLELRRDDDGPTPGVVDGLLEGLERADVGCAKGTPVSAVD